MEILNNLKSVKQIKEGYWKACCPAHDDNSPSLAISLKDNKLLLKCWAGCTAESIVSSVGLKMTDLFLDEYEGSIKNSKEYELNKIIVDIVKADAENGRKLSEADKAQALKSFHYLQRVS